MNTLEATALASIADACIAEVESLLLSSDLASYDSIKQNLHEIVAPIKGKLTRDMAQQFVSYCLDVSAEAAFVISIALGPLLDSISTKSRSQSSRSFFILPEGAPRVFFLPDSFLCSAIALLPSTLTSLNVSGLEFGDRALIALSQSAAASSLGQLCAVSSYITDDSGGVWSKFSHLEELDLSDSVYYGVPTLREIAKMSTLRRLNCFSNKFFPITVANSLIHHEALPNLAQLSVRTSQEIGEVTMSLLASHPNRSNFELLSFGDSWISGDRSIRLHQLCPNLTFVHGFYPNLHQQSPQSLMDLFLNVREVDVEDSFTDEAGGVASVQFIVSFFPRLFPLLEKLYYHNADEIVDFSIFPHLKELSYSTRESSFVSIIGWPSGLESLRLNFGSDGRTQANTDTIDAFYSCLASSLTNLQSLYLTASSSVLHQRHVVQILSTLSTLTDITLPPWKSDFTTLAVSHPTLQQLRCLSPFEHASLPSLTYLCVKDDPAVCKLPKRALSPALKSLKWLYDEERPSSCDQLLSDYASSRYLRNLHLLNDLSASAIQQIGNWQHLHKLNITSPLKQNDAKQIAALPWLYDLAMKIKIDKIDYLSDLMQHPRRSRLHLTLSGQVSEEANQVGLNINVTGEALPAIKSLSLFHDLFRLPKLMPSNIVLSNLRALDELSIGLHTNLSIEVSECPYLTKVSVSGSSLQSLMYAEAQYLNRFELRFGTLSPSFSFRVPATLPEINLLVTQFQNKGSAPQYADFVSALERASKSTSHHRPYIVFE